MSQSSPLVGAVIVGTAQVLLAVGAASRPGRRNLYIANNASAVIYVGPSGVLTTSGFPLQPNDWFVWDSGEDLYAIAAGAGNDVRVIETL